MKDLVVIGIDPGAVGGFCFNRPSGEVECHAMPATPRDACDIIATAKMYADMNNLPCHCFMEEVGGYVGGVGQPGSAMFNFGKNFGRLEGFLIAMGIPFTLVRPQKWQPAIGASFQPRTKAKYDGLKGDILKAEKARVAKANANRKRDNKTN